VRLCDIGAAVQEVMESYEVELDGKTYQVRRRLFCITCAFASESALLCPLCALQVHACCLPKYPCSGHGTARSGTIWMGDRLPETVCCLCPLVRLCPQLLIFSTHTLCMLMPMCR
jgi:hypothetical protein